MTEKFVACNPVMSRTIEIRTDQTLNQLHRAIFQAFGRWDDCHLSEFNLGRGVRDKAGDRYLNQFIYDDPEDFNEEGRLPGSMARTRLGKLHLQVGQVFWYWYDFGDNWEHRITVVAIGEAEPGARYPRVITETGESPPQYLPQEGYDWEADDLVAEDDGAALPHVPWAGMAQLPEVDDVETGVRELPDGTPVEWRHEILSEQEASVVMERAAARTFLVTTVRELPGGKAGLSTYLVPGAWLNACVRELGRGSETVLAIEAV